MGKTNGRLSLAPLRARPINRTHLRAAAIEIPEAAKVAHPAFQSFADRRTGEILYL